MGTGDVSPPGGAPQGYFRLRPKVTKERLRGENPVWLRAYALAHRIFPLRTPVTEDAVSVRPFYDRREVIQTVSAFVPAAAQIAPHFGASAPTTRLTRRRSLEVQQLYRLGGAAAGGRSRSNQVLCAGQQMFRSKGLPRRGSIRGCKPLIRTLSPISLAREKWGPAERPARRALHGPHRSTGGEPVRRNHHAGIQI